MLLVIRQVADQVLANLSKLVDVDGAFPVHAALEHVGIFVLIRQRTPSFPHNILSLLALHLRVHLLDDWHFLTTIEAVSCEEFELTCRLHSVVVGAELDPVNLVFESIDLDLDLLDAGVVVLLALLCQLLELASLRLGQLVGPARAQIYAEFTLAQMRQLLFHFVEVLVLEDLVG